MKRWAHWRKCRDSELLGFKLSDLGLPPQNHELYQRARQIAREVRSQKIRWAADFYTSNGFFVPDASTSVALPFYLFHSRLQKLERDQVGAVEGGRKPEFDKLIRHELGHVVDNSFHLKKKKRRLRIFGPSNLEYSWYYDSRPHSRQYVQHLGEGYAQSHPDEDFAETFAVWLRGREYWLPRYRGTGALAKLEYMDEVMSSIRGQEPRTVRPSRYEGLSQSHQTLGEYYRDKSEYRRESAVRRMDPKLRSVFTGGKRPAQWVVRDLEKKIVAQVANETGLYHYHVRQVVNDAVGRCSRLNLTAKAINRGLEREIVGLITKESRRYQRAGLYRKTR